MPVVVRPENRSKELLEEMIGEGVPLYRKATMWEMVRGAVDDTHGWLGCELSEGKDRMRNRRGRRNL